MHALLEIGACESLKDPVVGVETLERAAGLARALNSPELGRALNNLAYNWSRVGDLARSKAAADECITLSEQFGDGVMLLFVRAGIVLTSAYRSGDWDEALRFVDEFLSEVAGGSHYQMANVRRNRALIRVARDDVAGALDDVHATASLARQIGDPQRVLDDLPTCARVLLEAGRVDEAEPMISEFFEGSGQVEFGLTVELPNLAVVLCALDKRAELQDVLDRHRRRPGSAPRVCTRQANSPRPQRSTASLGSRTDEAHARLRAAEALLDGGRGDEAQAHLRRALEFYVGVRASRYVRQAEALAAVSA